MPHTPVLFSIRSYHYLGDEIRRLGGYQKGEVQVKMFPDGERYQRILTHVNERDVILVGGTTGDADTLELFDLACAMVKNGALSLNLIIPYYGYSTMERGILPGEVVTGKSRARLLSAIPLAAYGNRVMLMDLHSEGLPYYFEGEIVPKHLYAKSVILKAARDLGGDDFVLASTDAGRAKWVESLANDLKVPASFILKRRLDGEKTEVTAMNANVEGKTVIIYDDMIRTGGSLINAARAYKSVGADKIFAIATHGIFPGGALERIKKSGMFEQVVTTNTHPRVHELECDFLRCESVAGIFVEYLDDTLNR